MSGSWAPHTPGDVAHESAEESERGAAECVEAVEVLLAGSTSVAMRLSRSW